MHESHHARQYEVLGALFLPIYLWLHARCGYAANPLEREAEACASTGRLPIDDRAVVREIDGSGRPGDRRVRAHAERGLFRARDARSRRSTFRACSSGPTRTRRGATFSSWRRRHGQVVGGTLFHWLAEAGSGFSSFLGVARAPGAAMGWRGACTSGASPCSERASQGRVAGRVHRRGQPYAPVRCRARARGRARLGPLGLAATPSSTWASDRWTSATSSPSAARTAARSPSSTCFSVPARQLQPCHDLVVATMRAYWSPWLGNAAAHYANELESRAGGAKELALISPVPAGPP